MISPSSPENPGSSQSSQKREEPISQIAGRSLLSFAKIGVPLLLAAVVVPWLWLQPSTRLVAPVDVEVPPTTMRPLPPDQEVPRNTLPPGPPISKSSSFLVGEGEPVTVPDLEIQVGVRFFEREGFRLAGFHLLLDGGEELRQPPVMGPGTLDFPAANGTYHLDVLKLDPDKKQADVRVRFSSH